MYRNVSYRDLVMSIRNSYIDLLKSLAIFFMIIDHIDFFLPIGTPSAVIIHGFGRLAMPLFFVTHGYLLAHTLVHPPALSRIIKIAFYGSLVSTALIYFKNWYIFNILFQFVYIELLWLYFWSRGRGICIQAVFLAALYCLFVTLVASFIFNDSTDYLNGIIEYGAFPLFYSVAGSVLGYRVSDKGAQIVSMLILVITLSFQYNFVILALASFLVDPSFVVWLPISFIIPALVWYIPKSINSFAFSSPLFHATVYFISRNALTIYVSHILLFISLSSL